MSTKSALGCAHSPQCKQRDTRLQSEFWTVLQYCCLVLKSPQQRKASKHCYCTLVQTYVWSFRCTHHCCRSCSRRSATWRSFCCPASCSRDRMYSATQGIRSTHAFAILRSTLSILAPSRTWLHLVMATLAMCSPAAGWPHACTWMHLLQLGSAWTSRLVHMLP